MFMVLQDGSLLNTFWLDDIALGGTTLQDVDFIMMNGTVRKEHYNTIDEAKERIATVKAKLLG